jgi:hypothetical protein
MREIENSVGLIGIIIILLFVNHTICEMRKDNLNLQNQIQLLREEIECAQ